MKDHQNYDTSAKNARKTKKHSVNRRKMVKIEKAPTKPLKNIRKYDASI